MQHIAIDDSQPEAGPSRKRPEPDNSDDEQNESEEEWDGLGEGMDPEGFAGEKIVKPLTKEDLAAFKAAQDRAGVIYISRIPPGMQPPKVRHLMSQHGEVGRVYLQQEGELCACYQESRG
jgi:ESF2/ABP1 family protein